MDQAEYVSLVVDFLELLPPSCVIERINEHLRRYYRPPVLRISVGAACCPTHAICADDLLQQALLQTVQLHSEPDPAL